MNTSDFRFTLDLTREISQVSLPVRLHDTHRRLCISLRDGGSPFLIPDGYLAMLEIKRPTGTVLQAFCKIERNSVIVYDFAENEGTAIVPGVHNVDLVIYSEEGTCVGSPKFTMVVSERVVDRDDVDLTDEDYTAIDAMVKAEASRQASEAERIEAEKARAEAEARRELSSEEAVKATEEATERANYAADALGGVIPFVSIEGIEGGHRVTVTGKDGYQSFDVMHGADGEDRSFASNKEYSALDFCANPEYAKCYQFRTEKEFDIARALFSPSSATFLWKNGVATYESTAKNNWLQIVNTSSGIAEGSKYKFFKVRYRVPPTTLEDGHVPYASMFWRTYDVRGDNVVDPIEDGVHSLVPYGSRYKMELIADDQWHDVVYDLSSHANWDGGLIIVLRWQFSLPVDGPIYFEQFGLFETAEEAYAAIPSVSILDLYKTLGVIENGSY